MAQSSNPVSAEFPVLINSMNRNINSDFVTVSKNYDSKTNANELYPTSTHVSILNSDKSNSIYDLFTENTRHDESNDKTAGYSIDKSVTHSTVMSTLTTVGTSFSLLTEELTTSTKHREGVKTNLTTVSSQSNNLPDISTSPVPNTTLLSSYRKGTTTKKPDLSTWLPTFPSNIQCQKGTDLWNVSE